MTTVRFKTKLDKEQFEKFTDFLVWLKNDRKIKTGLNEFDGDDFNQYSDESIKP